MRGVVGHRLVLGVGWGVRQAGVEQDPLDPCHRCRYVVVVDDSVLIVVRLKQLPPCHFQPPGHRVRRLGASTPQPFEQLVGVRRFDEDRDGFRIPCQNRKCTLDVDFEHDPLARSHPGGNLIHERAVPILPAVNLAAFQEIAGFSPTLELLGGDKMVVNAILFTRPGRPRGG